MSVRETSLEAYYDKVLPELTERQEQVLIPFYENPGRDYTNHEIARYIGLPINCVTGRTQELRGEGERGVQPSILRWKERRKDKVTGNNAKSMEIIVGVKQ
ncbi:hypothetical protein AKJ59_00460 [candidate division MSBL1 archaeon SCGC-AAA385M02]|uniref:Uncharacterized protein n=1 Tax=candidate division MSBL1 archaeon SCGC-AAA385M02 TaxID=1698287 RepID=A0A133VQT3_9EURY|nr:hypothetical protein AKJ59_00460 [candidate division MSBL1 archaeon SCGC-AAA385M02]